MAADSRASARALALGLAFRQGKRPSWTDDQLREAVRTSRTVREALGKLGIHGRGGNYATFHKHVRRLGLSLDHFLGSAHLRGQVHSRYPLEQVLVENSTYSNVPRLAARLLKEGLLERRCYECQLTEWRGAPIPIQLDHINGCRTDHRLTNLRFLCPNCHALTPTFCGRNATKQRRAERRKAGADRD